MYIESDNSFEAATERTPDVVVAAQHGENTTTAALDYEAFFRDERAGTVNLKCYDAAGGIIWLRLRQTIVEELVFGEI